MGAGLAHPKQSTKANNATNAAKKLRFKFLHLSKILPRFAFVFQNSLGSIDTPGEKKEAPYILPQDCRGLYEQLQIKLT
jgi:hypothetical protein